MENVIEIPTPTRRTLFDRAIETQAAIDLMEPIKRDEIATYDALREAMGCDPQHGGRSNVNSARRYLQRENGMVFVAVPNVGYKRLTDAAIVESSPEALTKSRRASRRAAHRLTCVEFDDLSKDHKIAHQVHLSLFGAIQAIAKADSAKKLTVHVRDSMRSLPLNQTLDCFRK